MIRRPADSPDGQSGWLLISQVQHARLSGFLADHWRFSDLSPQLQLPLRWVARHHDDGWSDWEKSPQLDPDGRPLSFLEMPVADANAIWQRSIDRAREHSPLAGHLVAEHFLRLRAGGSSDQDPAARAFASRYQPQSDTWLRDAEQASESQIDRPAVERAVRYLQIFDRLSLTLCGAPPAEPCEFPLPDGDSLVCRPITPWSFRLAPWRFATPRLQPDLAAVWVPVDRYPDVSHLKQAAKPEHLRWILAKSGI